MLSNSLLCVCVSIPRSVLLSALIREAAFYGHQGQGKKRTIAHSSTKYEEESDYPKDEFNAFNVETPNYHFEMTALVVHPII